MLEVRVLILIRNTWIKIKKNKNRRKNVGPLVEEAARSFVGLKCDYYSTFLASLPPSYREWKPLMTSDVGAFQLQSIVGIPSPPWRIA